MNNRRPAHHAGPFLLEDTTGMSHGGHRPYRAYNSTSTRSTFWNPRGSLLPRRPRSPW